jgi:hypothetical protein
MGLILWPDSGDATATPVNINSDFTVNTRFMALNSVPITPPKKRKGTYNCGRSSASYPFEASYIYIHTFSKYSWFDPYKPWQCCVFLDGNW